MKNTYKLKISCLLLIFHTLAIFSLAQLPTVTSTNPSLITEISASAGGNVTDTGSSAVTARGICWNTTGTPTLADSVEIVGAGAGAFIFNFVGLSPYVTYYVRAYATNGDGTAYGAQVSFCCRRDWIGTTNRNWNTTTNWNNSGVPTRYVNVWVTNVVNTPLVIGNMQCNNLTIEADATLIINPGQSLYVYGTLTIDGNLILKSDVSGVASIIVTGAIAGANANSVVVEKYISGTTKKSNLGVFHYVSSPVNGAVTDSLPDRAYIFNETNPNNINDISAGWEYVNSAGSVALTRGRGYSINNVNPATIQFVGALNAGNINFPVTNSAKGLLTDGWNLIGNPYPSSINATTFIMDASNAHINGTLYYWDDDLSGGTDYKTNDYATWNGVGSVGGNGKTPNGFIPSGQGFVIKANSSGNVLFRTNMRVVNAGVSIKSNEEESVHAERVYLQINSTNDTRQNELLVAMTENATFGFDRLYDSYKLQGNANISFYTLLGNEKFAIQSFPTEHNVYNVNIGYDLKESGSFEIKLRDTENTAKYIYLEDKQTNTFTNLRNTNYYFTSNAGVINDRFVLHITDWVLTNKNIQEITEAKIKFINAESNVEILNLTPNTNVIIYDMQGRIIENVFAKKSSFKYQFNSKGIYIINLINDKTNLSYKFINR